MKFDVKPACRHGQVIPKYQLNAVTPIRGVLDIQQEWWPEHNRHSLRATITGEGGARDILPPLYDVELQHLHCDYMTICGIEVVDDGLGAPREVRQAWLLRTAGDRDLQHLQTELSEARRLHALAAEKAGYGPSKGGAAIPDKTIGA